MDISYLLFLQRLREAAGGILDGFMLEITSMAESVPTFLLLAGIYWCMDKRTGQLMGWNTALACTWSQFVKAFCRIDRPWLRDTRVRPVEAAVASAGGYSFPSGHTARAIASWGAAASHTWAQGKKDGKKDRQYLSAGLWAIVFLIMFSRNYLGVHTPQDVGVSFLTGLLFLWAVRMVLEWADRGQSRDLCVWFGGCLFCFFPMLRVGCLTNAGAGMGLLTGWLLERRFVKFKTAGTAGQKWARFVIGAVLAVFLLKTVSPVLGLFMAGKYAGFFSMFLFGIYLMAGYPLFFSRIELGRSVREKRGWMAAGAVLTAAGICVLLTVSVIGVQKRQRAAAQQTASADHVQDAEAKIYLELKDIGDSEGFEETVLAATDAAGMTQRCVFASFRYEYLEHLKELNADVQVLYNTLTADPGLTEAFPADFYGIMADAVTPEAVREVHQASRRVFVWTADTPNQIKRLQEMGVDGIVTNDPGLAGSLASQAAANSITLHS